MGICQLHMYKIRFLLSPDESDFHFFSCILTFSLFIPFILWFITPELFCGSKAVSLFVFFFFGQMKCKTCIFFYYLKWKLLVDEYAMLRAIYVIWYITEKLYMVIQRLLTTLLIVIYYFSLSPYFNLLFKHSF